MAYSSVSSKPNPKPKAHPSTSADAQSFELTKAFLDEHIFTLAALEEKAAPLVARITEELVTFTSQVRFFFQYELNTYHPALF